MRAPRTARSTVPTDFPTTAHLKLVSDGTQLTAHYSADGETWTQMQGTAPQKTDAQLGLVAAGDTGATPTVASVDWFRVTPDREAPEFTTDDEFEGDALDGCRWAQTVRYDADHVEVADGHLKVTTQPGDINGNNPLNPRNFVLQAAPEGDWVATTRLKAPLLQRYQLAGLLMYADDDNYVKSDVVAYNAPGAALDLRAELAGESDGAGIGNRNLNIADSTESGYWYLRVTKTGDDYTSEVSDGGTTWTSIGQAITFDKPLTGLGLMAIGPEQDEPVVVEFDYVHLESEGGEPDDTTAPTTSLTWSPAEPDGVNGWYTTAPSFSLAADDGEGSGVASTEYRIGDGAWTAYAGEPVAVTAEGTTTVSYRSTDEAGNVEEGRTGTVKLDSAAPVTTASQSGTGPVRVTLTAADAVSGVAATEYRIDDGAWTAYAGPFDVTGAGTHTVGYRSTDDAGNAEADQSVEVTVGADPEPVDLEVTSNATSQCVNGDAHVAVYARNTGNVWADIRLTTQWGTYKVSKVAPGSAVYRLFDTDKRKVKKGKATVAAYHWDGTRGHYVTHQPAYAKLNCKKG